MAFTDRTRTIVELQQSVLDLLTDSETALARAGKPLGREKHYRELAKSVAEQRRSVGQLELRMAIVAPMKAGKSTIINAILGQGLLPTRNSAMTSVPTEIECANELDQAKLTLDPTLIAGLKKAWKQLHHAIGRKGVDAALALAASEYPELTEFVRRVAASDILTIENEQHGLETIRATLADLNDLCRVAPLLSDASPLEFLSAARVPRIAARFVRNSRTTGPSDRLVIVDTPGPNEARQHARLQEVVLEQLQTTSLVLLVLDYTQLNTQAAEQLNLEVQKVMGLVGEDSVFVLVNKIDERNETGMTTEQVKQFVIGHLKLTDPKATNRIFEVSAKRAFRAASFLRDIESLGEDAKKDDVVRAMHSTRELALSSLGT
jgi:GTPase Era involved in 16S rRNA processing